MKSSHSQSYMIPQARGLVRLLDIKYCISSLVLNQFPPAIARW